MSTQSAPAVSRTAMDADQALGTILPSLRFTITQQMIDDYAKASGDFNPIHVDPEFARTGPFGRPIAHGLLTLAFVAQMLNAWSDGTFDQSGEIDITFIAPVYAGDEVSVSGIVEEVVQRDGALALKIKLSCAAGERQILVGNAIQPIAQSRGA